MRHRAAPEFWRLFERLSAGTQALARRKFELLQTDPRHPSLHFKHVGRFRSVRVGLHHRALGVEVSGDVLLWFWIGSHADYDKLLG